MRGEVVYPVYMIISLMFPHSENLLIHNLALKKSSLKNSWICLFVCFNIIGHFQLFLLFLLKTDFFSHWMSASRIEIDPDLSSCTKIKSKLIKDFIMKADTLSLVEEKVRNNLEYNHFQFQFCFYPYWALEVITYICT